MPFPTDTSEDSRSDELGYRASLRVLYESRNYLKLKKKKKYITSHHNTILTCSLTASLRGARISSMFPSIICPSASCSLGLVVFFLHKQTDVENVLFTGG